MKPEELHGITIRDLDRLDGREFEDYLATLFGSLGYAVKLTPESRDYGADLILTNKDGVRIAVQAKKRTKNTVGLDAVQQVIGARGYYKCDIAIVI
ncbi:MAG: restriction endonuclease, partial [Candidatus Bathyarchaeota archaeon]|nr:restriction endonuclease [Candidatus Bathyarchaeota archaeon]